MKSSSECALASYRRRGQGGLRTSITQMCHLFPLKPSTVSCEDTQHEEKPPCGRNSMGL